MRKTRFILFVLAFMMFGVINAEIASGTCGKDGDNITWVLDDDGTLTLSGSGEMEDYNHYSNIPWYSNRAKITNVSISEGITSIGNYAFLNCRGLTSVTIPNSVKSIGEGVFYGCSGLTSVTIPNSVTSIGEGAFNGCSGLTSVTIPNSVKSIGEGAFYDCSRLTYVTMSNSMTSIGSAAFAYCSALTFVIIPNSVTSIGESAFYSCSGLTSVTIPNSVTSIGDWTFAYCSGLTSVTIPNSVTSIGEGAFKDCSGLTSVTIPNSVTSIGRSAFLGCAGITTLYCNATTPPTAFSDSFAPMSYYQTEIFVPKGTKDSYASCEGWKNFLNIVEMDDSDDDDKEYLMITKKNGEVIKIPMDEIESITPKQVETIEVEKIVEVPVEVEKIVEVPIYIYDDSRSEIQLLSGETIVLTITNGIVNIEDAPMNELITIYTAEGELYEATRTKERVTSFNLPRNAIYIIKVGEKTFKVKI